jgi:hypothetical protein
MGHLFLSIMCFLVFSGRLFIWSRDVLKLYTIFCISGGRQLEMGDSACNNNSDHWPCRFSHITSVCTWCQLPSSRPKREVPTREHFLDIDISLEGSFA